MDEALLAERDAQLAERIRDIICPPDDGRDWNEVSRYYDAADQAISEARFSRAWAEASFCRWALGLAD